MIGWMLGALAQAAAAGAAAPTPAPTGQVTATGETQAVASARDAADDPAIWRDPRHPARSLIVATDKQLGLNVYALDGRQRFTLRAGRVNNVDLRDVRVGGRTRVLVAASDRNDPAQAHLALFELDPARATLIALGRYPLGPGEAYGLCLYQPRRDALSAFVVNKDGAIAQAQVDWRAASPAVRVVRRMKLATQSEGCVADDRTGTLYVAEEDVGIWRFDARAGSASTPTSVAKVDDRRLFADVEGLAIARRGARGGWLIASSQGDSAYAAFRLPALTYAGRFRIVDGRRIGGTSETDGIEVSTAGFGRAYPGGVMIAQDGDNAPAAQNFKLVPWPSIARLLRR